MGGMGPAWRGRFHLRSPGATRPGRGRAQPPSRSDAQPQGRLRVLPACDATGASRSSHGIAHRHPNMRRFHGTTKRSRSNAPAASRRDRHGASSPFRPAGCMESRSVRPPRRSPHRRRAGRRGVRDGAHARDPLLSGTDVSSQTRTSFVVSDRSSSCAARDEPGSCSRPVRPDSGSRTKRARRRRPCSLSGSPTTMMLRA
jgi:hypothetical protein